jgi:calcineurin-like phosphoesterase family protein
LDEIAYPFDESTWIISDTHFFHANIGRYCDRPDGWQETIFDNWNRLIQPEEIVFHVGDLALGRKEKIEGLVPLLTVPLKPGLLNLHGHIHNSPAPELGHSM